MSARKADRRPSYDPAKGQRNPYVDRLRGGSNMRSLDEDLRAVFPSSEAMNDALRVLLALRRSEVFEAPKRSYKPATVPLDVSARLLDEDLVLAFDTSEAVNAALHALLAAREALPRRRGRAA